MGYYERWKIDSQEKNLPRKEQFYIAELKTSEALLVHRSPYGYFSEGHFIVTHNDYPELPKTFGTYEEAFAWLERKLTQRVPDVGDSANQLSFIKLEKK